MIKKKNPQINHVEETKNVKWCVFKVPQYIILQRNTNFCEKFCALMSSVLTFLFSAGCIRNHCSHSFYLRKPYHCFLD